MVCIPWERNGDGSNKEVRFDTLSLLFLSSLLERPCDGVRIMIECPDSLCVVVTFCLHFV